jgi:hypothetical protein
MTATSIARFTALSLASLVACAAIVFGIPHAGRDQPVQPIAAPAALAPPTSNVADNGSAALSTASTLAVSSPSAASDDGIKPVFDVALIGRTGDAVIAGTAAPGATVELLRNGEALDRAVADQSGQFVMVLPHLPPGNYEMALRSSQPDGKQATSERTVAISLSPSPRDQLYAAVMTPVGANVALSKPVTPSCHPSRTQKQKR